MARRESRLGRAEQQAQRDETVLAPDEGRRRRDQPPAHHDAGQPDARADAVHDVIAGRLDEAIADEEDPGREAIELGGESHLLVHGERRETDVHAVEIGDEESDRQQRHNAPADLGNDGVAVNDGGRRSSGGRVCHGRILDLTVARQLSLSVVSCGLGPSPNLSPLAGRGVRLAIDEPAEGHDLLLSPLAGRGEGAGLVRLSRGS